MLHQIDRKVILGLADLIHIHKPFLMQFVFSSGVALLILAPALVPGSNAILLLGGLLTALLGKRLQPERAYVFLILCAVFTLLMGAGMLWGNTPFMKYLIETG